MLVLFWKFLETYFTGALFRFQYERQISKYASVDMEFNKLEKRANDGCHLITVEDLL